MKTVLIIEDDVDIGNLIEEALTREGYGTLRAYSGTEALLVLEKSSPDLALLDLMLPGLGGEKVLEKIRGIPVIVVSAIADMDEKISLLLGGAADYVTKPFDIRELTARVKAQLRAPSLAGERRTVDFGGLTLDPDARAACCGEACVRLTRTECAILRLLMCRPEQVVTRSAVLELIAEDTPDCTESSLKTHISHLRAKLRGIGCGGMIESVWGIGFRLRDEISTESQPSR